MKIGILTITDYGNYGNRLQNYALQKVLEDEGYDVVSIKNMHGSKKNFSAKVKETKNLKIAFTKIKNKLLKDKKTNQQNMLRQEKFMKFNRDYIVESEFILNNPTMIPTELSDFDAFVIGSDQVWNYEFSRFSKFDFAYFSNQSQKVISYAASFGVSEIPNELIEFYKEGLKNIDSTSVREETGQHIIKKLCNKNVEVVLDPTMLITQEEWGAISNPIPSTRPYIVTYFLGNVSDERNQYLEKKAAQQNCEIKKIGDINDCECWTAGPEEFLGLIMNAHSVYTDSYHACVFSIIFEKYFEVFDRETDLSSMNSRIETLLRKFDLKNQKVINLNNFSEDKKIDFLKVKKILEKEKQKSLLFIEKALVQK